MRKTVVIDVVGLSTSLLEHMPFLKAYTEKRHLATIKPMLPAVTTAVQSTYLTGQWPCEHGIVGNGWYDRTDCEIKFWKQSNKLVDAPKIWDKAKQLHPEFTVSQMCWWYNMYANVDYSLTPRPNYLSDGRKIPDCYTFPADLRDYLREKLGDFPLFNYWGPTASIVSSQYIADASILTDQRYHPTMTFIYLPHLDYCLQKFGQDMEKNRKEMLEIDQVVKQLVEYYEAQDAAIIILSEYGISNATNPIDINRLLRKEGLLAIREERGLEILDPGASKAFAVADHQMAHIYINDPSCYKKVKGLLEAHPEIELVLDREGKRQHKLHHSRSGDLVAVAAQNSWFTYYYWLDDKKAPDFARLVEIFRKPGYDPVEMFMDPKDPFIKLKAGFKLLKKKLGFRYLMNVIPLDATLIKGSHGRLETTPSLQPVIITSEALSSNSIQATDVYQVMWKTLNEIPFH
ncbi:putative AlkP superfamily pyrophosphatase or phosphodiesterase [Chitinophaga dinghuensis]|uniref:Putative AlkP superfamily pyrophosphatase or phosphodiesterase n=1 Tax=Chitinophaga dinghuensis TaxID=1539050 RepID=A0A327VMH1_9BACT|nr:nucleotide pyrophosphatase/phosphodiesterase family protein [Chitinophaga dinghuensis]RAJ75065.1 putative AlkP superfamily pyrophosphatase or phosphodiesterase [Chitinophaga dinghuensis]